MIATKAALTSILRGQLRRLGWTLDSASQVTDDLGAQWRFDLDSPAAVARASPCAAASDGNTNVPAGKRMSRETMALLTKTTFESK